MAGVPDNQEPRPAAPVVLPISSRGLVLSDRVCQGILAIAMAVAAALILYLNRGTFFYADELGRLLVTPEFDLRYVVEPHAGHLTATSNLVVQGMVEVFGADYTPFRVLGVLVVLLCAGLFYAFAKRRIGALAALAPTLPLLVFGSAWDLTVIPFGFAVIFSTSLGLGALLALERDDRAGDVSACILLAGSVVTFSVGLAFTVGVAVSVLLRHDRWRRLWIPMLPAALYAAWWLWALSQHDSSGGQLMASNVLLIPAFVTDSLAAAIAAIVGLNYNFGGSVEEPLVAWGQILAIPVLAALVLRIRRGRVTGWLWATIGIALALWVLGALVASSLREPGAPRYLYAGSIAVLLVATEAARGVRFSRLGLAALFAVCAISVATNLALLRDGANLIRNFSAQTRASMAMAELARDQAGPGFRPLANAPFGGFLDTPQAEYLAVVDRYGSPAFTLSELERQSEPVREEADRLLGDALGVRLRRSDAVPDVRACRRVPADGGDAGGGFDLPRGGATIRATDGTASLALGRFATTPSIELGRVAAGDTARLEIPGDASPKPWRATAAGATSVVVCPLG